MKPHPFEYVAPTSMHDALEALTHTDESVAILAGGQSLVPLLNARSVRPEVLLDLGRIEALTTFTSHPDSVILGPMLTLRSLERRKDFAAAFPALSLALARIGNVEIRNRSTVGGTVAFANPAGQFLTVVAAMGGRIELASSTSRRTVDCAEFLLEGKGTVMRGDEMVASVQVPKARSAQGFSQVERHVSACIVAGSATTPTVVALGGICDRVVVVPGLDSIGDPLGSEAREHVVSTVHRFAAEVGDASDRHTVALAVESVRLAFVSMAAKGVEHE